MSNFSGNSRFYETYKQSQKYFCHERDFQEIYTYFLFSIYLFSKCVLPVCDGKEDSSIWTFTETWLRATFYVKC